ncbi:MAG: hypothetical protein ACK45R_09500 [Candidatus Kapaibacterium sp.]|jgi:hypothetical protein
MTAFSMILSFVFLILGGYGFSSTKVASLNLPLMEKIAPTVHSWVFLHPLVCGLVLFAFAVMSVSDKLKHKALQAALAVTTLAVLIELPAAIHSIQVYAQGMRPSLEDLLQTETGVLSLIFAIRGAMFYKKASAAE